jgi:hypothetical protein
VLFRLVDEPHFWIVTRHTNIVCIIAIHFKVILKQKKLPTQHTPNPEAQVPEAVPPFVVHSALVKHVP